MKRIIREEGRRFTRVKVEAFYPESVAEGLSILINTRFKSWQEEAEEAAE